MSRNLYQSRWTIDQYTNTYNAATSLYSLEGEHFDFITEWEFV